eukprot:TRINITY_DN1693_c0_g1_i2.p1 TRINITY_DN1693_c0_g1~~TRINITY_DN1693_c0_g1_i2.p1  ORF type:complete len:396 (-),score=56.90 TRINITY_DN1693_c0_g1_i2:283-1470(-)
MESLRVLPAWNGSTFVSSGNELLLARAQRYTTSRALRCFVKGDLRTDESNVSGRASCVVPSSSESSLKFRKPRAFCRASSSASSVSVVDNSEKPVKEPLSSDSDPPAVKKKELFACPVCFVSLDRKGPRGISLASVGQSSFRCSCCKRNYSVVDGYADLTVSSAAKEYYEVQPTSTELFRSPFVSFLYERGWRQNFARAGFPGVNREFELAQERFRGAKGGVLVDASCGSGLFTRKFASAGMYSAVVGLDFSEKMLQEARSFIQADPSLASAPLALVRADIARLPFETSSVDAVHAGAALHCWPSPFLAVAEICRVLKPGGTFVATTFLNPTAPFGDEFVKPFRKIVSRQLRQEGRMSYWEAEELEDLCAACGLSLNYSPICAAGFIFFSVQKSR